MADLLAELPMMCVKDEQATSLVIQACVLVGMAVLFAIAYFNNLHVAHYASRQNEGIGI